MPRVITIDPGKSKCGLVLAEISEKKVYKAIIVKTTLLEMSQSKFGGGFSKLIPLNVSILLMPNSL